MGILSLHNTHCWILIFSSHFASCFQVTAGGKLYNVVVDSEETGKQLLQKGALRRRVTIIPLNKIQSYVVQPRVQQATARLVYGFFIWYFHI